MKNNPKVCVATIDPSQVGGVTTMKEYFCKMVAKNGYEPFIVFFPLDPDQSIRVKNFFKKMKIEVVKSKYLSFDSYSIGAILSEFQFTHYLTSRKAWKEVLRKSNLYFAVSGTNQCCLPYVLNKLNFSCWLGNVFPEEAKHYFRTYPFIQKLITIISYPICLYFDKLIYEKAKRILVLSEYMKNKIIERYKVPDDKIWVVPYPIDTDYFSPPVNKNPINGMVRILFVGRINDERKNVQMLLKAFNIISSRNDNVELLLVGDEPSAQLSEFTNKLGLVQKVNFVSDVPHDQIKYFYNISDIFVLPSLQEGLGIVVLEAMSCGIPSVITRCGGPEWLIKDGINGFLVENNNEIEFASAIEKLVDNPDLRLQIGSEARNTIINRCSNKVVEPMLLRALEELKNDNK